VSKDSDETTEEDDGSLRKSFWEHLDDLRKVLIRSVIAVGIALVVCLLFDSKLVDILEYPLQRMDMFERQKPTVSFQLGKTKFGPFEVTREEFPSLPPGDAPQVSYQLGVARIGENDVLTFKAAPASLDPKANLKIRLHNFGPTEGFFVAFHVALYGALVLAAPFWIYFLGQFFLPALHLKERRVLFIWLGWGTLLFFTGVLSCYFVLLPLALRASVQYSELLGFNAYDWRADEYIRFVTKFLLGMGIGFQFPVVILILVKMGILDHAKLSKYRRHVVVISFVLGAVLTTPEVITQVAMAVPLYLLYEACIWIAWYWERKKRKTLEIMD
jgi:sec-independent protein translocase protein TatC